MPHVTRSPQRVALAAQAESTRSQITEEHPYQRARLAAGLTRHNHDWQVARLEANREAQRRRIEASRKAEQRLARIPTVAPKVESPPEPEVQLTPEERLLRAIFGKTA